MDVCGVCGGDGTGCVLDCYGAPNGRAQVDQCGVCGGTNRCIDCSGTIGGSATIDNCRTCDADPSNDCVMDICYIWGGDGSSCGGIPAPPPPAPPPPAHEHCVDLVEGGGTVCPVINEISTGTYGTTFQLGLHLSGEAHTVYSIFGDGRTPMTVPPCHQEAAPFGANVGGTNTAFASFAPDIGSDSWLTVGLTDGDPNGALSSVGVDFAAWGAGESLHVNNGAIFWMEPNSAVAGTMQADQRVVTTVMQITPNYDGDHGFRVVLNAQGNRRTTGSHTADWDARDIVFTDR